MGNPFKYLIIIEPCLRGVPQGSVLGPILFVLYIRSLPQCVPSHTRCLMYADDICLTTSDANVCAIQRNLQASLDAVGCHLTELGLHLNPSKSQLMIFRKSTQPRPSTDNVRLVYQGSSIPYVEQTRYLGVELDEVLTFCPHVDNVCAKVNQKLCAFRRIRSHLDVRARRTFYFGLIQSTMEYASNSYVHSLTQSVYDKLIKCYKRSLRITFGFSRDAASSLICQRYHICPLQIRFTVKLHCLVYRCLHNLASPLLCSLFKLVSSVSGRCTTRGWLVGWLILFYFAHIKTGKRLPSRQR